MKEKNQKQKSRLPAVILFLAILTACITVIPIFTVSAEAEEINYIYFDLAADNVTINKSTYTGAVYETVGGVTKKKTIQGTHNDANRYYVYQSTEENKSTTGLVDGEYVIPEYQRVAYDGENWGDYITNNTAPHEVSKNWATEAGKVGREGTDNYITLSGGGYYDVTIDNLWSTKNDSSTSRQTGGIACSPSSGSITTIRLKGDNRFGNIHYNYSTNEGEKTRIEFVDGEDSIPGSMTVVSYDGKANHYNSVIGGNDGAQGDSCGMWFSGGIIYAGGRWDKYSGNHTSDNCTAIGGGGNETGVIKICGATVTAVSMTTGTAIGGGIGFSSDGGEGYVDITSGKVYAYNMGYIVEGNVIPACAIGGAGSNLQTGATGYVNISGGEVYAKSIGGAAIGGGSSYKKNGGNAVITIGGNAIVTALSVGGRVGTDAYNRNASPGVSIGGGKADKGGETKYNGGYAKITISGGILKTGSIGGGACENTHGGKIGYADVEISGGTLQGQVIMAGGATQACKFTMTGGKIDNSTRTDDYHFVQSDGGAVYMDDDKGECTISGGSIANATSNNGGAIYMTAGKFVMSGGAITSCHTDGMGGALYLDGGTVEISGGEINNCYAANGGAVYMSAGSFTMSGTGIISNCYAQGSGNGGALYLIGDTVDISGGEISNCHAANGGAVYMSSGNFTLSGTGKLSNCYTGELSANMQYNGYTGNGGAVYLGNGNIEISGGEISNCHAANGGAVFVGDGEATVSGGTLSGCTAKNGGAIRVNNGNFSISNGALASNSAENGGALFVSNGNVTMTGGQILNNHALLGSGGGMMVQSDGSTAVTITSGEISNNDAKIDGGAIAVSGGASGNIKVIIGLKEEHFADGVFVGCDHNGDDETDKLCPILNNNTAAKEGGAIFILGTDDTTTQLEIYCIVESGNRGGGLPAGSTETSRSDFMKVEGGAVSVISSADNVDASGADNGYNQIGDSMHITGGTLNISGSMVNPRITAPITVDVTNTGGAYNDERTNNETGTRYFKVNYYENFYENGKTTGEYTSYFVAEGDDYKILPVMYPDHPGYSIRGWNISDDPDNNPDDAYEYLVNSVISFTKENIDNSSGNMEEKDKAIPGLDVEKAIFVLYAYWDFNSYYVKFEPNIPGNQSYTGQMALQTFSSTSVQVLPDNAYRLSSYYFLGWSLDKSTVILTDAQTFEPLTTENGTTVTLYAMWHICSHHTETVDGREYIINPSCTVSGNKLTQSCSCGRDRYVTMTVQNSVYNGQPNTAVLSYSSGAWGWEPLTISYTHSADLVDGKPVNAGDYTASITVGGTPLALSFVIEKASQPAPTVKPTFTIADNQLSLTVDLVDNSQISGAGVIYGLSHYDSNGIQIDTFGEVGVNTFEFDKEWTTYFVTIYYAATDNYKESDRVSSDMQFLFKSAEIDVLVFISKGAGINCLASAYEVGDKVVGIKIEVSLLEGFFFPDNFGASMTTSPDSGTATFTKLPGEPMYTITNIQTGTKQIHVTFSDAYCTPTINISAAEGQVFENITGSNDNVKIEQNSAFTVKYSVINYFSNAYKDLSITFNSSLPKNTTLLLKDMSNGTYWYYIVGESGAIKVKIEDFTEMGGSGKYVIDGNNLTCQIIVDFSQVNNNVITDLGASMTAVKNDVNSPALSVGEVAVELKPVSFSMSAADAAGLQQDIDNISFAASAEASLSASKWEDKVPVLVLTPANPGTTLGDMKLTVKESIPTNVKTTEYIINADGSFIIPLSRDTMSVSLIMTSNLFSTGTSNYAFNVAMYASAYPESPMNDEKVTSDIQITFTAEIVQVNRAINISTEAPRYDTNSKVQATVEAKELKDYRYEIMLMAKDDNDRYTATAYFVKGEINSADFTENVEMDLQGYRKGAYALRLTIRNLEGAVVDEIYSYFIIYDL